MKKRIRYKLEKKQHIIDDLAFHELCEAKKKDFPEGPWNKEPNKIYFKAHGFDCMVKRHGEFGNLCGYVGVTKKHPMFGVDYSNKKCFDLNVHGGITFSNVCVDDICHPGKNKVFWFGFDCAHGGDYKPGISFMMYGETSYNKRGMEGTYKDIEFVKKEYIRLAKQLRAMQ